MSFTAGEVIRGVKEESHESSFNWFDRDDAFYRWLNDGLAKLSRMSKMYREQESFTLEEDKTEYQLNDRFIEIDEIKLEDSTVLPVNDRHSYGDPKIASVNYSIMYRNKDSIDGTKPFVVLTREPSGDEDYNMDVHMIAEHPEIIDDKDKIYFPREFRAHIVDYINYRIDYSDHETTRVGMSKRDWEKSVLDTIRRYNSTNRKGGRATDPTAYYRADR